MKPLGNLIITVCLVIGVLAAATAYFVPVNLKDSAYDGLELGDIAGVYSALNPENAEFNERITKLHVAIDAEKKKSTSEPLLPPLPPVELSSDEKRVPTIATMQTGQAAVANREELASVGRAGDPITPELLAELRSLKNDDGSQHVRALKVSTFSFSHWTYWWVFVLSLVGLAAGAVLVRIGDKRAIAALTTQSGDAAADASRIADPAALVESAAKAATDLQMALALIPTGSGKMHEIVTRFGALQQNELLDFVSSRPVLIAKYGLGGFAAIMDHFSAAERQVNRAWSAAADGVEEEAIACMHIAEGLLKESAQKIRAM